ncbi:MAG: GGDEF domain-containing protein [Thiobacillus sp.]
MKYQHTREESAEYLRLALPLMSSQNAAFHPVSYAVWYEYVAGMNNALKLAADSLLGQRAPLGEDDIATLFERYVADVDDKLMSKFITGFQQAMSDISESTAATAQEAHTFDGLLQTFAAEYSRAPQSLDLHALRAGAAVMQTSMRALQTQLDQSQSEIQNLRLEVARARDASRLDGLTGLTNRIGFEHKLEACLSGEQTAADSPCLLMCDIDHFKQINDTYGHLFGDKVIRAVAGVIKENVKGRDTAARFGGEEFIILLPDTSLQGAHALAEQIRRAIERGRIKRGNQDETIARVTVSIGVARHQPGESPSRFIDRADQALYAAKQGGRNRVSLAAAA